MQLPDKCKELFLEGITDVMFYPKEDCIIPVLGNGTIYTYNISANIEFGGENVRRAYQIMRDKEYYVVLRKMDGSLQLCYSLPHTFGIGGTTDNRQTELARPFTATTQALSEPIPITLRE